MERSFNTTGPCFADEHYMLPPERRLGEVLDLIGRNKFFVLYAGRQTGKTTSLMWLTKHLRTQGTRALCLDVQTARDQPDPGKAFRTMFNWLDRALDVPNVGLTKPTPDHVSAWLADPETAVLRYLRFLAAQETRPLVLFVDEADCLVGETLITFLTQLRDGYIWRKDIPFPASVALAGMRAIRDYAVRKEDLGAISWLGTASPFNVTTESLTLSAFTEAETGELLHQHTEATGQAIEPGAVERVWQLAEGHPWLTNALADQATRRDVRDRSVPVTAAHVDAAKETIILERRSHIDSLIARLQEPRIARILTAMLIGDRTSQDVLHEDFAYAVGMGLLRHKDGEYQIANAVYREVIPRVITFTQQSQILEKTSTYALPDGGLDLPKLMRAWQKFWQRDGHLAAEGFGYREAGPHLMLMAFLQRIMNGGGRVEREYGLGRGALDLLISWKGAEHAIEVKLRRDTETEPEALDQLARYLDHANLKEGWLVMFDLRRDVKWADKLPLREVAWGEKTIHVVGC